MDVDLTNVNFIAHVVLSGFYRPNFALRAYTKKRIGGETIITQYISQIIEKKWHIKVVERLK